MREGAKILRMKSWHVYDFKLRAGMGAVITELQCCMWLETREA